MIARFADATTTLAAGLAIGFLIAEAGKSSPDVPPAQVPHSSTAASLPTDSPAENTLTDSDTTGCYDITSDTRQAAIATPEPVPDVYRGLIGPLGEQTSTPKPYDLYVAFARDVRDEPWAAAMEAGIANWSAGRNPSAEAVIDYIECRSSSCMVAGHSPTGNLGFLGKIRDQGWWQGEGASMKVGYSGDILLFFNRYADTN